MEINQAFLGSMLKYWLNCQILENVDVIIWLGLPISNQERLNFVKLSLKSAARADKRSLVNQCSHKIDFSLYRAKRIPVYVLAGKGGFSIHRCNKSILCFSIRTSRNRREELSSFLNVKHNKE